MDGELILPIYFSYTYMKREELIASIIDHRKKKEQKRKKALDRIEKARRILKNRGDDELAEAMSAISDLIKELLEEK